jgi:hypothetical protein
MLDMHLQDPSRFYKKALIARGTLSKYNFYMQACLDFIESRENPQRDILQRLHDILAQHPGVTGKIRFKVPFYYRKSWICYLNPLKNGGVELCFLRGNELSNEQDLLDAKGRKQVYGVEYRAAEDIRSTLLDEVLQEALLLDEEVAYASKRSKKKM